MSFWSGSKKFPIMMSTSGWNWMIPRKRAGPFSRSAGGCIRRIPVRRALCSCGKSPLLRLPAWCSISRNGWARVSCAENLFRRLLHRLPDARAGKHSNPAAVGYLDPGFDIVVVTSASARYAKKKMAQSWIFTVNTSTTNVKELTSPLVPTSIH